MERLDRFDVVAFGGTLNVVVESALLPQTPAIVVVPLSADYPFIQFLNPHIMFEDQRYVLATRLISPVKRARLRKRGDVRDQGDAITRAVDVMMAGV